jgi:hypothetical protein
LKKRRFLVENNNLKAKRAREEKAIEEYSLKLLDNSPNIVDLTVDKCKQLIVE